MGEFIHSAIQNDILTQISIAKYQESKDVALCAALFCNRERFPEKLSKI